jgi:hypothetical protein
MTYMLFLSLCYGVMMLSAVPSTEAFQNAQPMRNTPVSSSSGSRIVPFSVDSPSEARRQRQRQTQTPPPLTAFNTHHLEGVGSVSLADRKQEALSKQIASLEIAMEEQKEGVPVLLQNKQDFIQERQELEGKLSHFQAQFETALQELELAREHERQTVNDVSTEARRKIRQARSEGREVSERVRIDMTKRLSTKDQEIKQTKISLAQKEVLLEQWQGERGSIKMLLNQAWSIVKSRRDARKDVRRKKAAEVSARNKAAISSEWSTTTESARILATHMGRLLTSFLKVALFCTPFLGSKVVVASGAVLDKVGGKKE